MSSVGSFIAQVPKGGNLFVAINSTGAFLLEANVPTSASAGFVSQVGSSTVVATTANAVTAITASGQTITSGEEYVDMGKKLYLYVNGNVGGVAMLYAVLSRVKRIGLGGGGGLYEGGDGRIGYIVTFAADVSNAAVRPGVVRTGSTNGGI